MCRRLGNLPPPNEAPGKYKNTSKIPYVITYKFIACKNSETQRARLLFQCRKHGLKELEFIFNKVC